MHRVQGAQSQPRNSRKPPDRLRPLPQGQHAKRTVACASDSEAPWSQMLVCFHLAADVDTERVFGQLRAISGLLHCKLGTCPIGSRDAIERSPSAVTAIVIERLKPSRKAFFPPYAPLPSCLPITQRHAARRSVGRCFIHSASCGAPIRQDCTDMPAKSEVVTVCSWQFVGEERLHSTAMILITTGDPRRCDWLR